MENNKIMQTGKFCGCTPVADGRDSDDDVDVVLLPCARVCVHAKVWAGF